MRFIVDECTGPGVSRWLRSQGHDVVCVYEEARGLSDIEVLECATSESRLLITNDRDFGEKIFRERHPHAGVVLLRLADERTQNKVQVIRRLLEGYAAELPGRYIVVSEQRVRFAGE